MVLQKYSEIKVGDTLDMGEKVIGIVKIKGDDMSL